MAARVLRLARAGRHLVACRAYASGPAAEWALPAPLSQRFTEQELRVLQERFLALRDSTAGMVTARGVKIALAQRGISTTEEQAQSYITPVDHDRDGGLTWHEFVQTMWEMKGGYAIPKLVDVIFPSEARPAEDSLEVLFRNNREWVQRMTASDPNYFAQLKKGQQPRYLFIGCADSRVPAQELLGMKAGEMFVHRNVANIVVNTDLNFLSVLTYAVEVLGVKDIIVCGHSDCGGVRAAHSKKDHGLVEHWIRNIRDVARLHAQELATIKDEAQFHMRMVELNVMEQCVNLHSNPVVQRSVARSGSPLIHGFVYDVGVGLVRKVSEAAYADRLREVREIYDIGHLSNGHIVQEWNRRVQGASSPSKQ